MRKKKHGDYKCILFINFVTTNEFFSHVHDDHMKSFNFVIEMWSSWREKGMRRRDDEIIKNISRDKIQLNRTNSMFQLITI